MVLIIGSLNLLKVPKHHNTTIDLRLPVITVAPSDTFCGPYPVLGTIAAFLKESNKCKQVSII